MTRGSHSRSSRADGSHMINTARGGDSGSDLRNPLLNGVMRRERRWSGMSCRHCCRSSRLLRSSDCMLLLMMLLLLLTGCCSGSDNGGVGSDCSSSHSSLKGVRLGSVVQSRRD